MDITAIMCSSVIWCSVKCVLAGKFAVTRALEASEAGFLSDGRVAPVAYLSFLLSFRAGDDAAQGFFERSAHRSRRYCSDNDCF